MRHTPLLTWQELPVGLAPWLWTSALASRTASAARIYAGAADAVRDANAEVHSQGNPGHPRLPNDADLGADRPGLRRALPGPSEGADFFDSGSERHVVQPAGGRRDVPGPQGSRGAALDGLAVLGPLRRYERQQRSRPG